MVKHTSSSLSLRSRNIFFNSDVEIEWDAKCSISLRSWWTVFGTNKLLFSKHLQTDPITLLSDEWHLLDKKKDHNVNL